VKTNVLHYGDNVSTIIAALRSVTGR